MSLSIQHLLRWAPEIGDVAKSTNNLAASYTASAEFIRRQVADSDWQGEAADAAHAAMLKTAAQQDQVAATLTEAGTAMKSCEQAAEGVADQLKAVLNYADEQPAIQVDTMTNEVKAPQTGFYSDEYAAQVEAKAADVQAKLAAIVAEGEEVDADMAKAEALAESIGEPGVQLVHGFKQGGGNGPTISGPGTKPAKEGLNTGQQDDLDTTIPGTGIALGGDGKDGYPHIHVPGVYDGRNPLPVPPDTRPLPTGTAIGPNGEHYAFYAIVPYHNPDGSDNHSYTSPNTVVVDLAHPEKPLYTLNGISQASGAYDAASGRMVIVGNTPTGQRALWESAPVSQNAAWGNTLQQQGTFSGAMNGNRESQIVALPKGGFMVVGAGETPDHHTLPIEAVTASTPEGLLTAVPTALVTPQTLPQVYGPTITEIRDIDGKEVITMRVSTYGDNVYDPHTYTTTFTVNP